MINEVLKKRRRDDYGKVVESRSYYWRYRFDPMPTDKWVSLKTSDKQVAQKKAQDFYRMKQQEAAGLIPKESVRNAGKERLAKHLEDFLSDLESRGRTAKHVADNGAKVSRLMDECGWDIMADVQAEDFIQWRNGIAAKLSAKTLNEYLASAIALFNWMEKVGRISNNPLQHVEKADGRGKLKRERRAFTEDELRRLLDVAGPNRMAYFLAACTGLRRGELEQLTWGDVHLKETAPYIFARASTTKNKKDERVFLVPELSEELESFKPEDPLPSDLVLVEGIPRMREIRKDLEKAGITYCDDKGRYADFHSLRHTCATFIMKNGMPVIYAKKHMRHSDLKLTNRYMDDSQLAVSEELKRLPRIYDERAQIRAQISGPEGQNVAQTDANGDGEDDENSPEKMGLRRTLTQGDAEIEVERVMGIEPMSHPSSQCIIIIWVFRFNES